MLPALRKALNNLSELFSAVGNTYQEALEAGQYEIYEEKKLDKEWLQKFKEDGIKRKAAQNSSSVP